METEIPRNYWFLFAFFRIVVQSAIGKIWLLKVDINTCSKFISTDTVSWVLITQNNGLT